VGIVCLVVIVTPFHGGPTLTIGNTEIKNPPFWQVLVTTGVTAPLLWIALAALTSKKAQEEFTSAAPPARVSGGPAGGPAASEP
jgi:hypothetical protein